MKYLKAFGKWLQNILLAIDLLANAILLGDPRETISSRIGKKFARNECKLCRWICKYILDPIDPRHCQDAVDWTEGRGSDSDDSVIQ